MHLHIRRLLVMLCTLGLLLGSLSAALGRGTPAHAATPSGAAYAWGANGNGQLGNGTIADSNTPVPVSLPSGVTATVIAAGSGHSLAIDSNGKVYAWGANFSGRLGNGTTAGSSTPVAFMLPGGVAATEIAAGYNHSLAIDSNGKGYAWGLNNYGQVGNGIPNNGANPTPVAIMLPSNVTATKIAGGSYHSLAIGSDKKIYAWGANTNGQLGNTMSNQGANGTPMPVSLPAGMIPLALGAGSTAFHSLAILTSAPTAAILSRFRVVHAGNALVFRWRVASGAGVRGFFLTAGTHRLNSRLIQSHAQRSRYAYASRWQGHGPYLLHGVLPGGAVVTLASTG